MGHISALSSRSIIAPLGAPGRDGAPGLNADGTTADEAMTTIDSDPDSDYRQQADARLAGSYARVVAVQASGNGVINDTPAFTAAAAQAAALNADVYVPAPAVSYKLNSNPVVPNGVGFVNASPSWFSGTGKMPFHRFTEISEGVDPRIFDTKVMGFFESVPGEDRRKWGVVGWVRVSNPPDPTAAAAQEADFVGVDGRGVTDVKNGRVWGGLFLVHMTENARDGAGYGVSQAYGVEIDVNNNTGEDSELDWASNSPPILGMSVVSGGQNSPAEALRFDATRKPYGDPDADDNRWHTLIRARGDVVKNYVILLDDGCEAVFARIPSSSDGVHWTHLGELLYAEYVDIGDLRKKMRSFAGGNTGFDFLTSTGNRVLATSDTDVELGAPLRRKTNVMAAPGTINANLGDVFTLIAGATTVSGISGGHDGQRLTIINVTGGNLTVNQGTNMRQGGNPVVLADTQTIEYVYSAPTWFRV